MTVRREAQGRSPLALRLIHAALFLAFAAGAVAAAVPEWRQVVFALERPYHAGAPPRVLLALGSVVAATGALGLLAFLVRGRSAPLSASWLILGGAGLTVLGAALSPPSEPVSELALNTRLLQLGQRVQLVMVGELQEKGEVPTAREPWQAALERIAPIQSPLRTRLFQQVPLQVLQVPAPEDRPEPLTPGTLLLYVSSDGASFELRLVGLAQDAPQVLGDETGAPVVLRGLYNPDVPATSPGR